MTERHDAADLRLDHLGIAVGDLEAAREAFAGIFGCPPSPVEEVPGEKVRVCFFQLGNCRIELLEPTSPDSPIRRFLDRGRSGVHHVALSVEGTSLEALRESWKARGLPLLGDASREGSGGSRVTFLHPRAASGVLLEFIERSPDSR